MKFIGRIFLALVLAVFAYVGIQYLLDPRPIEQLIGFFTEPNDTSFKGLTPRETISGDGSFVLPMAKNDERTIALKALEAGERYAAEQNSYALIVVHKGVIQSEWYAEGWNRDRLTQSQSMHKSILPILIQAAIEDGDIGSLQDPVGKYITEWADDPRGAATIENHLHMSSGLLEYPFALNPFSDAFLWLFGSDTTPVLLRTPQDWTPGEKFEYNNVNSELLGLIIERATGKRYAAYLEEKLWRPMGADRAELWLDQEGGKAHSSCCLLAPAMDWVRFGMMLLDKGKVNGTQIVRGDFIDLMITPAPFFDWYGYQIWLGYSRELNPRSPVLAGAYQRTEPFDADDTFYTSGYGGQRVYVVPSADLVIVRMGPFGGRAPVEPTWDNTFLVNTMLRNRLEPLREPDEGLQPE